MDEILRSYIENHMLSSYLIGVFVSAVISHPLRMIIGKWALTLAIRTETVTDDLIIDALRPFRFVYAIPVAIGFFLAPMAAPYTHTAKITCGLLFTILVMDTISKTLNGLGEVFRHKAGSTVSSYASMVDLAKLGLILVGLTVIVGIFFDTSPLALLSGIGAFAAVLMLVFKDTALSIVANLQNVAWNHFREGDWIEVPEYYAEGIIERIGLYNVELRNWDLTKTLIPTHKMLSVATKNYRNMEESRARQIRRKLYIDIDTIHFCDRPLLDRLIEVDSISEEVAKQLELLERKEKSVNRSTNLDLFFIYSEKYLREHVNIHHQKRIIMIRQKAPEADGGLPIEVWAFAKSTDLLGYEATQAEVFSHLIGNLELFNLKAFQRKVVKLD